MKTLNSLRPARALFAVAVTALLAGCATHEVKVDAISRTTPDAPRVASYRICQRNAPANDQLRYQEAARHIKTALSGHGLWEAPDPDQAELVVELDFGMTAPRAVEQDADVPLYAAPADVGNQTVLVRPPSSSPHRDEERVDEEPQGQFVGFADLVKVEIVTEKHLSISCRENRPASADAPPVELWRVSASIESPSRDLRDALPVLATVVMERIGTDTHGAKTDTIAARDDAIDFIRKGL